MRALITRKAIAVTTADQTTVMATPVAWITTWLPMLSKEATPPSEL